MIRFAPAEDVCIPSQRARVSKVNWCRLEFFKNTFVSHDTEYILDELKESEARVYKSKTISELHLQPCGTAHAVDSRGVRPVECSELPKHKRMYNVNNN